MLKLRFCAVAAVLFLALPNIWAGGIMVVDRGLPSANLNNAAGADRSNVDWADDNHSLFYGDDFTVAETYTINTVRVWFDQCQSTTCDLASYYSSLSLYGSNDGTALSVLQTGSFTTGQSLDNANIVITPASYPGAPGSQYQASSGSLWQLWQVDFTNLNWVVPGGTKIQFGVKGVFNDASGSGDLLYLEASNAAKGGVPADGADGLVRHFDSTDLAIANLVDSNQPGIWDKSSDINVQILANAPEPGSLALLATGLAGLAMLVKRRRA